MDDGEAFSRRALIAVGLALCLASVGGCRETSPGADDAASGELETIVDLAFFGAPYDGAEVCVARLDSALTCGEVGLDDELRVRPAVVGHRLLVVVTRAEASVRVERDFEMDLLAAGADPDTTMTTRVSVGLARGDDGACQVYLTNHEFDGSVVTSTPPASLDAPCGPFATP